MPVFLSVHRSGEGFFPQTDFSKWSVEAPTIENVALGKGFGSIEFRQVELVLGLGLRSGLGS